MSEANSESSSLRLIHLSGSHAGKTETIEAGRHPLGRHDDSRIRYDHATDFLVSTRHGHLAYTEGRWQIEDAGSTNGTWLDGDRVQQQTLRHGQTVVLGTPGGVGSASFRVDLEPWDAAMPEATAPLIAGGTPLDSNRAFGERPEGSATTAFAQEPPLSIEAISFSCEHCRAINVGPLEKIGQTVACRECGRQTLVRPSEAEGLEVDHPDVSPIPYDAPTSYNAPTAPAAEAAKLPPVPTAPSLRPPASASEPVGLQSSTTQGPRVVLSDDSGFLGGILGNVKGTINRMRERRELVRQLGAMQLQLPKEQNAADAACVELGHALWREHQDRLSQLQSANQLASFDAALAAIAQRRAEIETAVGDLARDHEAWVAQWKARHNEAEQVLTDARQQKDAALAAQREARQAAIQAAAIRLAALSELASQMSALAADAKVEPPDDFDARYDGVMTDLRRRLGVVRTAPEGWPALVEARKAAAVAITASEIALKDAAMRREASQAERRAADDGQTRREREHSGLLVQLDRDVESARHQHRPAFLRVGREAVAAPGMTEADLPQVVAARDAVRTAEKTAAEVQKAELRLGELV